MKVEKTMTVNVELGTVLIGWDSSDPTVYSLSIDQGGDDRVWEVKQATIRELKDACERILEEAEAAAKAVGVPITVKKTK